MKVDRAAKDKILRVFTKYCAPSLQADWGLPIWTDLLDYSIRADTTSLVCGFV